MGRKQLNTDPEGGGSAAKALGPNIELVDRRQELLFQAPRNGIWVMLANLAS